MDTNVTQLGAFGIKTEVLQIIKQTTQGGCGYDKSSTALSSFCNKLLKIVILKNDKKIINNENKHCKFYACEPLYFQYGVGLSSYETMFKNLGYKTNFRYLTNDNIVIDIEK